MSVWGQGRAGHLTPCPPCPSPPLQEKGRLLAPSGSVSSSPSSGAVFEVTELWQLCTSARFVSFQSGGTSPWPRAAHYLSGRRSKWQCWPWFQTHRSQHGMAEVPPPWGRRASLLSAASQLLGLSLQCTRSAGGCAGPNVVVAHRILITAAFPAWQEKPAWVSLIFSLI